MDVFVTAPIKSHVPGCHERFCQLRCHVEIWRCQ